MKNFLLGFLLGILVATAGVGLAQSTSGSVFDYGEGNIKTFQNADGTTGTLFPYAGGITTYQDSTGRSGSLFTYPGTGITSYSFSGGKQPC